MPKPSHSTFLVYKPSKFASILSIFNPYNVLTRTFELERPYELSLKEVQSFDFELGFMGSQVSASTAFSSV